MSTAIAPPMPYGGGKQRLAGKIAALLPEHSCYVEPFAGALSVLLAKPPAPIETINDLNRDLITFWRILRDRPDDLARVCSLTPHSRSEFAAARDLDVPDDLERARRVWVQLTQGRGARIGTDSMGTGWRFVHDGNRMALSAYLTAYLERIAPAAARLRSVSLECRDALDVIRAYGNHTGALLYVDPPYLAETRYGTQYAHEFDTPEQHTELLQLLTSISGMVALSGYDSDLYRDHLTGWHIHRFAARNMRAAERTEVLWTNYQPVPTLLEAS